MWLPGPAAHADIWAASPTIEPLEPLQARTILDALGASGTIERFSLRHHYPQGYYRFTSSDNRILFLKIVANDKLDRYRNADTLARWVTKFGVSTSLISAGFPKAMGEDFQILGHDFMSARYGNAAPDDLKRLGVALARLHRAMRDFPDTEGARADSRSRADLLQKWCERARGGKDLPGPDRQRIAAVLANGQARIPRADAQMIHGDLNRGNILFCDDGQVAIIDYETALSSWGDPALDLAVVLQRFVLVPVSEDSEIRKLARALFDAYKDNGGWHSSSGEDVMADLNWISARNIALLCEITALGNNVSESEWEKQLMLGELTQSRQRALCSAFSASV
jgi:hypothetical protein